MTTEGQTRVGVAGSWAIYQVTADGERVQRFFPQDRVTCKRALGKDGSPIWFESEKSAREWALKEQAR